MAEISRAPGAQPLGRRAGTLEAGRGDPRARRDAQAQQFPERVYRLPLKVSGGSEDVAKLGLEIDPTMLSVDPQGRLTVDASGLIDTTYLTVVDGKITLNTTEVLALVGLAPSSGDAPATGPGGDDVPSGSGGPGSETVTTRLTTTTTAAAVVYRFLALKTDGGGLTATATDPPTASAVVNWTSTPIIDSPFSYDAGTDELTVGADADGLVGLFSIQINGDDFTTRTQVVVELQQDTGGGFTTLIRSSNYNSRDTDQNEGATAISGYLVNLSEGDKFRVMCANNHDGTVGIFGANGCFWSVVAQ